MSIDEFNLMQKTKMYAIDKKYAIIKENSIVPFFSGGGEDHADQLTENHY